MGQPSLADDERFVTHTARGKNQDQIERLISDWAGQLTRAEVTEILNEAGVVCGPVYAIDDIFNDPQFRARDMLVPHHDSELGTIVGPGVVPKFSETPGAVRWSAEWTPGAHNDEVYADLLGFDRGQLDLLRTQGVI